ncbi:MAG: ThuA domain-containing protein [Methanobacteriota archaeon]|nr:MAG: ThuA domain-containing protein [Euryarchaeota archaeon]
MCKKDGKMKNLTVILVVGALFFGMSSGFIAVTSENHPGDFSGANGGKVYYIMPTHHVESLEEPNIAQSIINAIGYLAEDKIPINVLVFSNAQDRGLAINGILETVAYIVTTLTFDDSDLEFLSDYDVVILHSNGHDFPDIIELSIQDYLSGGGSLIGSHDIIWAQFGNPILEEDFGASAYGDGSYPGDGWYNGDFTALKVIEHPITTGLSGSWELYYEQFFFDLDYKKNFTVLMGTVWQGEITPIAWTFTAEEEPSEIEADVDCDPDSLNLKSKGNWITCYIELPDGYDPKDIDASTILQNEALEPELDPKYGFVKSEESYIVDHDNDGILERMVKFDRMEVEEILAVGKSVELVISGYLEDGTRFEGRDHIRVFEPLGG